MKNKTYLIKKDNILDALDGIDNFVQMVTKINDDDKARNYDYIVGLDLIGSSYEVNLTLSRNEGHN